MNKLKSSIPAILFCFMAGLTGCQSQPSFSSLPPPALDQPIQAVSQAKVKDVVGQFIGDVQRGDYAKTSTLMSPALSARMPAPKLAKSMDGQYLPFVGSTDWQFDSFQPTAHGSRIIVHAHFVARDHDMYRTNFAFVKSGESWLIDAILDPSKPHNATSKEGHLSASPMQNGH